MTARNPAIRHVYRSLVLLLGVGGLRWGEAIALRVCDIDFLRRRIALHRTVVVPAFVMDALAATAGGKGREDLLWTAPFGGYLRAPGRNPGSPRRLRAARRLMRRSPG